MSTPKLRQPAFHIRPASEHDLLEITEIEQECGLSAWGWDGYYKELTQEKTAFMFVARLEPQRDLSVNLGGFITSRLVADEVHVHNFGVRPALRRLGMGGALLRASLDYGLARGAVGALLEVRASNKAAQALYASRGFTVAGRRKNYYDHPTEDAVLMSAKL
jgi:ribosomal-protein-alanine N-acetyltransferase